MISCKSFEREAKVIMSPSDSLNKSRNKAPMKQIPVKQNKCEIKAPKKQSTLKKYKNSAITQQCRLRYIEITKTYGYLAKRYKHIVSSKEINKYR